MQPARVRGMDTQAAVEPTTDRQLQEKVLTALNCDGIDRAGIGVTVSHGVVTLQGRVESRRQAWVAEQAVYSTPGVLGIANELHVEAGYGDNDSAIAEDAVRALTWLRSQPFNDVRVIVADGFITLCGVVADIQQRGAAERAVRGLRGVRSVWNGLSVHQAPESYVIGPPVRSSWTN